MTYDCHSDFTDLLTKAKLLLASHAVKLQMINYINHQSCLLTIYTQVAIGFENGTVILCSICDQIWENQPCMHTTA